MLAQVGDALPKDRLQNPPNPAPSGNCCVKMATMNYVKLPKRQACRMASRTMAAFILPNNSKQSIKMALSNTEPLEFPSNVGRILQVIACSLPDVPYYSPCSVPPVFHHKPAHGHEKARHLKRPPPPRLLLDKGTTFGCGA